MFKKLAIVATLALVASSSFAAAPTGYYGGLDGVGLNYGFTPTVSGRAEVQKPSSDSTYYGVGIVVKF